MPLEETKEFQFFKNLFAVVLSVSVLALWLDEKDPERRAHFFENIEREIFENMSDISKTKER